MSIAAVPTFLGRSRMKIVVNAQIHLAEFRTSDKDALVSCLNDKAIYDRTLRLPYPYTDAAADAWLAPSLRLPASAASVAAVPPVAIVTWTRFARTRRSMR